MNETILPKTKYLSPSSIKILPFSFQYQKLIYLSDMHFCKEACFFRTVNLVNEKKLSNRDSESLPMLLGEK